MKIKLTNKQIEETVAYYIAKQQSSPKFEQRPLSVEINLCKQYYDTKENIQIFPLKGTICWVWNNNETSARKIRISNGKDRFYYDGRTSGGSLPYDNYEVVPMGISFSDEIIHGNGITPEMDKQLALCWDKYDVSEKTICVIDAINKCAFRYHGSRNGATYHNYKLCPIPVGNLSQMYRNMINSCQD